MLYLLYEHVTTTAIFNLVRTTQFDDSGCTVQMLRPVFE